MKSKGGSAWIEDILGEVRRYVESRKYRITNHARREARAAQSYFAKLVIYLNEWIS